ncbi:MAG: glycoside hydrolase family 28 protein [Bacteroidota bacterium]
MKYLLGFLVITLLSCTHSNSSKNDFSLEKASAFEKIGWDKVPEIISRIQAPTFMNSEYIVTEFGAIGDSTSDNRMAFQEAINKCSKNGGGRVLVSSGEYFVDGPIHFRDNVNLHLEEGARIFFGSDPEKYLPLVKVRWEGTVCYNYSPLIYGYQLKNIAITGKGEIDGNAIEWSQEWRKKQKPDKKVLRQMGNDTIPEFQRVFGNGFLDLDGDAKDDGFGDGLQHYLRPTLVEFYECENILLDGITFKNSPFWTVHPVFSKNVTIRNLKVYGEVLNDDGIDPDSCEDVLIENNLVKTHDDAISIKAGRDQDAWQRPGSRNIIVRNNQLQSGVNALCIGSEMSGGVSYLFAEGNTISEGKHALNFKCNLDRGGQVQHVYIRNTTVESCDEAMFIFRMDYHGYRGNEYPTKFNDFYINNIRCKNVNGKPFKIVGVPQEPIQRIFLKDVQVEKAGEGSLLEHTENIIFENVSINGEAVAN